MIGRGRLETRELVYREKHAWLQTVVDQNDAVLRFSITVTDPRFRFQIRDLTFGHLSVKLGRSRFADLETWNTPEGRSLRIGAHNHEYAECYYFGNPGNYQHYVLSKNDAAAGEFGYAIERDCPGWTQEGVLQFDDPPAAGNREFDPDAPYAQRFRAETTINTLTVLGPAAPVDLLAEPRGPDANQTRVRMPTRRERRRTQKLIRRANRRMAREVARHASDIELTAPVADDSPSTR